MKKLLFISFFIIGCNSGSDEKIPLEENAPAIVNSNLNNELYEIDKEIISNPNSPNVYLKRALYHQNKRNLNSRRKEYFFLWKVQQSKLPWSQLRFRGD